MSDAFRVAHLDDLDRIEVAGGQYRPIRRRLGVRAFVVGGPADSPIPTSPFEYWFAAEAPYKEGDYDRAVEVASEGLAEWPESGQLNYQLACFHALAGRREKALEHLAVAVASDPGAAEWASDDTDLDSIRDDPAFPHAE
jgi:tetratricopeptide (TPR) repeat protein